LSDCVFLSEGFEYLSSSSLDSSSIPRSSSPDNTYIYSSASSGKIKIDDKSLKLDFFSKFASFIAFSVLFT